VPLLPIVAALPWLLAPVAVLLRLRGSPTLSRYSDEPPPDPALVSVIVPARDEARNIGRCVTSLLRSRWTALEVIVVDDHSTDDTARLAREAANDDARLRVIAAPALPRGWFGKQWACFTGARAATGDVLLFTDADTEHAPDLVPRSMTAMRAHRLDFYSVAGSQELGSFWERVVQPHVFQILAVRYGGARVVNESSRAADKIANGQCIFITRLAYDTVGGHEAVRTKAAEDQALAQLVFRRGLRSQVAIGMSSLTTRMYASLAEIVRGWGKNIYAGALDALPYGLPRWTLPLLLLAMPLLTLAPPLTLLASLLVPLAPDVVLWAAIALTVELLWWALIYVRTARLSPLWALTFPLGALVVLYIATVAIARGRTVRWKGREYVAE
jgi:chlorobactene glucosyltransferase